jgi:tetratricopeptide (TPR) repeat protein
MRKISYLAILAPLVLATPTSAMKGYSPADWSHARLEYRIGVDLIQHHQIVEALPHLEAALDQYPDDTHLLTYLSFAHRTLAKVRIGTAHETELRMANDYYMRVLDNDCDPRDFQVYMGELYLELREPKAAAEELKVLENLCPEGCAQRDALTASLASYAAGPIVFAPAAESPSEGRPPEATAAPTPLSPPAPERD